MRDKIIEILDNTDWSDNGIENMADKILALFSVSGRVWLLNYAVKLSQNSDVIKAYLTEEEAEADLLEFENDTDYRYFITSTKIHGL